MTELGGNKMRIEKKWHVMSVVHINVMSMDNKGSTKYILKASCNLNKTKIMLLWSWKQKYACADLNQWSWYWKSKLKTDLG